MPIRLSISAARAQLPAIVDALDRDPSATCEVTRRGRVVAVIAAAREAPQRPNLWRTIIAAAKDEPKHRGSRVRVARRKTESLIEARWPRDDS